MGGELLACPFCGGGAAVFQESCNMPGRYCVECETCKCGTGYWSRGKAIAHWNRRPPADDGWKLVPCEPTEAMIEAICGAHAWGEWPADFDPRAQKIRREAARNGHAAMLAASPPPPLADAREE